MEVIDEIRTDPLTGESFSPRRSNQIFASRANQIRFNNIKARVKRRAKSKVDRSLDKCRTILKDALGDRKSRTLSRDFLLGAGFDFTCITHTVKIEEDLYYFLYELGYTILENGKIKITKYDKDAPST